MPDWMCNIWRKEIPQLGGKVKLMPLPAWEKGGRRTSVWGGTMLAIAKDAPEQDRLWNIAKHLYLSKEVATRLHKEGDIVSPVTEFWSDPMYDQPDMYFGGQPLGRQYINLADQVPDRFNSPFAQLASVRLQSAASELVREARSGGKATREELEPVARELLEKAQDDLMRHVRRNRFYAERADAQEGAQ
jgi:arabinosaccharide transport system substrate-binding protein